MKRLLLKLNLHASSRNNQLEVVASLDLDRDNSALQYELPFPFVDIFAADFLPFLFVDIFAADPFPFPFVPQSQVVDQ